MKNTNMAPSIIEIREKISLRNLLGRSFDLPQLILYTGRDPVKRGNMGIFGAQKVSAVSAQDAKQMVEIYFERRGLNARDHALADASGFGWWLMEGSARVYILVQEGPKDSRGQNPSMLRITAPLVHIPDLNKEQFYRRLLDLNGNLSLCALSTHEDVVLVVAQRPTAGLDQEELDDLVWHVAYVADLLDNKLAEEFGCKMYKN
ncbi:MAG: hypothetical protein QG625_1735 [Cyanobacteriota bacterium erpe_2018_sw_39hr_WHONDRS-SW48-000098_B_bin.30]|jgi:hypothetical protein|nr:hypothetical protein [Cyanobacteriota bacterium erpe_2018_sw_39hr_WHONDRS-SW48-000098_B_bin.30]